MIYVELEGDHAATWQPVAAVRLSETTYRLPAKAPPGERWAYPAGSTVVVEEREFPDGTHLVACGLVASH